MEWQTQQAVFSNSLFFLLFLISLIIFTANKFLNQQDLG